MASERTDHPDDPAVEPALFVLGAGMDPPEPLLQRLAESGGRLDSRLSGTAELPQWVRARLREPGARPLLVLLVTPGVDRDLPDHCRPLQRLVAEGRFGLVVLVAGYGVPPETIAELTDVGVIDIIETGAQSLCAGALRRIDLAVRVARERHWRLQQEREFNTRLADLRVMQARVNYVASHDELTDLANRRAFEHALDLAILEAARDAHAHALLYLDLDRFKLHNEAAGHGAGDYLLQRVAEVLRAVLGPNQLLARLGSDEFAVLLQRTDAVVAEETAERLRAGVAAITPDGKRIVYHVGVSVGLTMVLPGAFSGASQALAQAEQACFVAKTCGGNTVRRYHPGDRALAQLREDMRWTQPLRRALRDGCFFLVFQPILSLADRTVSHFEALIRLPLGSSRERHTAAFMPAAERLGLAPQIDCWVIRRAVEVLSLHPEISLAVNLSGHAFQEPRLLPFLLDRLAACAVAPERLTIELTETAAVMNFAATRRMIDELRAMGCRFALDDFGSGFSSYTYLKQFPVDSLKIDGSFIVGLCHDPRDQAIVQSMIDIGHSLGKSVVAEFIEDAATLNLLAEMGVDYAQGFYVGRPSSVPAVTPLALPEDTP